MRTLLLTGGTGKLGRTLVNHFLAQGDTVINVSRAEHQDSPENINKGHFIPLQIDLTQPDASEILLAKLVAYDLHPDGLINNARNAGYLQLPPDGHVSPAQFSNEFFLDVIVPYELTVKLAAQRGSQLKRIVNIGSQYGVVAANMGLYDSPATQSPLHYSVAKAALSHLTKELAVRYGGQVAINCIAFGGVEGRVDDAFRTRYEKLCPMGRMLNEADIAGPVDFLLSNDSSGMTGHTLVVDGGWSIW